MRNQNLFCPPSGKKPPAINISKKTGNRAEGIKQWRVLGIKSPEYGGSHFYSLQIERP